MSGWTQTPNFIYDLMPKMKAAELKVVMAVSRQTAGWQRECATMRLADIEALTGLSHPSVVSGIKDAMAHGILGREVQGETFIYWLIDPCETDDTVKNFNTEGMNSEAESKEFLPSDVKKVNSETVKKVNTNKRNINTNKPKKETATQPATREATPQQELFGAVCEAIGWDYKTLSKDDKGQVAQAVGILRKADYTVEDVRRFMVDIWFHDWRWTDKSQRPTLKQLRQEIGKLRAGVPEQVPRIHTNGASKVAASNLAMDSYETLKTKHGATA